MSTKLTMEEWLGIDSIWDTIDEIMVEMGIDRL